MRLKSIKLAGFKSFAEPTRLTFPGQIVCIVGPNGCGKSNTLDAVRWVMGERAARELRGGELNDVLFNGSERRRPVSQCSVELLFDNSDHRLRGAWNRYAELAIRRVHHRDQGTQYYINRQRVRRRDVMALFDGTGLGPRSYALIGQGNISQIIEARPDQLRLMLEEAAGIGQYRQRRRETFSRLESARENLAQLRIQYDTWAEQAETLKRQSEAARRHRTLTEKLHQLERALFQARWQQLTDQLAQSQQALNAAQQTLVERQLALEAAQKERILAEQALPELERALQQARATYHEADKQVSLLAERLRQHRLQREQLLTQRARLETQQHQLRQQHEAARQQCDRLAADREALAQSLAEVENRLQTARQQWQQARETLQTRERESQRLHWQWREARTARQHLAQQLNQLERQRDQLRAQYAQLKSRLQAQVRRHETLALDTLTDTLTETEQACEAARRRLDAARQELAQSATRRDEAHDRWEALERRHMELSQERAALAAVHSEQLSLPVADDWLEAHGARPLVAHVRVKDPRWQTAVEGWLGARLRGVLLAQWPERWDPAVPYAGIEADCTDPAPPEPPCEAWQPLNELLEAPAPVRALARAVFCSETPPSPAQLKRLVPEQAVLTPDGALWQACGCTRPVAQDTRGALARQARLDTLEETLQRLAAELAEAEAERTTADQAWQAAKDRVARLEREVAELDRQILRHRHALDSARQLAEVLEEEIATLRMQLEEVTTELDATEGRLKTLEAEQRARMETLEVQHRQWQAAEKQLETARAEARRWRQQVEALEAEQRSLQTQLEQTARQLAAARAQVEQTQAQLAPLAPQLTMLDQQLAALTEETEQQQALQAAEAARDRAQAALKAAEDEAEAARRRLQACQQAEQAAERARSEAREALNRLELQLAQLQQQMQALRQEAEDAGLDMSALQQMPLQAGEQQSVSALQRALRQVRQQLNALGAVNMTAVEAWEALQAKMETLAAQMADVESAVETLSSSVRKIDRDSRQRLRQTFEAVNAHFARLFPQIFGGGEASLRWEGSSDDPLEDGLLVMARPPGKRNTRIQMLSGGEKTLTALALIFAIFEMKPAPFCILDEVDAPLDDANVQRFCDLVKIMAQQVQFILITHNKITMAMADQLIGVTMHEPGVSRIVSVDLQAALDMTGD